MVFPDNVIALRQKLKDLIPEGIGISLQEIKQLLPSNNSKYNDLLQLESRLKEANRRSRAGMISYEVLQREYANITDALIKLIDSIQVNDFEPKNVGNNRKKSKQGSILHRIPDQMELHKESRCIVRLAFTEQLLLEDIELDEETQIEAIRIAEVMGVELLDPNEENAFSIRTFNESEQFLDEDDYGEWIFYVKPLLEGIFPLLLKVSVLEEVRGKERVREIVLEENIHILTKTPVQDEPFKTAAYEFSRSEGMERSVVEPEFLKTVVPPAPATTVSPPKTKKRRFNYASIMALLLAGSVGVYIVKMNFYSNVSSEETRYPAEVEKNNLSDTDTLDLIMEEGKERMLTINLPAPQFLNGIVTLMDSIGNTIPAEVEKSNAEQLLIILRGTLQNYNRIQVEAKTGEICYGKIKPAQNFCECK